MSDKRMTAKEKAQDFIEEWCTQADTNISERDVKDLQEVLLDFSSQQSAGLVAGLEAANKFIREVYCIPRYGWGPGNEDRYYQEPELKVLKKALDTYYSTHPKNPTEQKAGTYGETKWNQTLPSPKPIRRNR